VIAIGEVLTSLAIRRRIFHSEADFQHAFAWEVHKQLPDASIRLEFPILIGHRPLHLDVLVANKGIVYAIELKYKTRGLKVLLGEEHFILKDQSAQDHGRYDLIKDIQRLEQIVAPRQNIVGHAIFLTNDSAYWTRQTQRKTVDADFRLHQGRVIQGTLKWADGASEGTKRNREKPLMLHGRYPVNWHRYSEVSPKTYGQFRYLAIKVSKDAG
jgi:hypothetical protein